MIIGALTIFSIMLSFVIMLIVLAKINRQLDNIQKSLYFIEKKIKEEEVFVTKTTQVVDRIEHEIKDLEGEIEWKG
ncbi:MAG TPA: hypothetical protein P5270_02790 [Victivallales bacterium]|nr:hypothetical protein [Victivallales bacterium]HRR28264.1 hypothetical protein [Victivallales bacterium]HRU01277.1 hypothetical protein [Victivallales bacterium]